MLGEIPVLGALFPSRDFQTDRTELVFIITPHLVKPLAGDYALPTDAYVAPCRADFFVQGTMEGTPKAWPAADKQAGAPAATGFDIQ